MFHTVQQDRAFAVKNVVQLGRALVVMLAGAVNVHCMRPGGDVGVLPTYEQIAPAAGAALSGRFAFVTDQYRCGG
jgi:hypothetical protein